MLMMAKLSAFNAADSISPTPVKLPKHYFNQVLYFDYYLTGKRNLDTTNLISKRLKSYQVNQFAMGYNIPVYTQDYYNKDSTRISNFHLLLTTSYSRLDLNFGGISQHTLSKFSIGARAVYNNGKKSIFFVEFSPFTTQDIGHSYTKTTRLASTVLYNYAANDYFSFRVGYTRSFFLGNRYSLPYIGIRVGKLDGINFSIQFPRAITFTIPMGPHVRTSLFTRPQGGLYTFANTDSLKIGSIYENNKLYFGRYEFLSGVRVDIQTSRFFNMYFSSGFTTRNKILFHYAAPVNSITPYRKTYMEDVKGSIFLNLGFVFRFGKTKSVYNNRQMYEAMDINNTVSPAENGSYNGNGDIPPPVYKIRKNATAEVLDLIEVQDLY